MTEAAEHPQTSAGAIATAKLNPEFLFIDEVAAMLRTSESTIRYWLSLRKLRSTKPGRRVLIRRADVQKFLEASVR